MSYQLTWGIIAMYIDCCSKQQWWNKGSRPACCGDGMGYCCSWWTRSASRANQLSFLPFACSFTVSRNSKVWNLLTDCICFWHPYLLVLHRTSNFALYQRLKILIAAVVHIFSAFMAVSRVQFLRHGLCILRWDMLSVMSWSPSPHLTLDCISVLRPLSPATAT